MKRLAPNKCIVVSESVQKRQFCLRRGWANLSQGVKRALAHTECRMFLGKVCQLGNCRRGTRPKTSQPGDGPKYQCLVCRVKRLDKSVDRDFVRGRKAANSYG